MILFVATSRVSGSDLGQLARQLASRISALPDGSRAVNLTARENGAVSEQELRELRRLLTEELKKRRVAVSQEPSALTIVLSFSEALSGKLLIAEIRRGEAPEAIILPVPAGPSASTPLRRVSLQKSLVWRQGEPILDFVLLPDGLLVLSPGKVSLIRNEVRGWTLEHVWDLRGVEHLPRDPRGRLLLTGSEFRAYLPRFECHAAVQAGSALACEPSNTGWPVVPGDSSDARLRLAKSRNYFDQLRTTNGPLPGLPPFYAAALLASQTGTVWALASLDGNTRFYNSRSAEIGRTNAWGPNLASAQVPDCSSWFLAVTDSEAGNEALQAFQWMTDHPMVGSERLELDGVSTALWADEGNRVRLVTRDLKSGRYAAWSVALDCAD